MRQSSNKARADTVAVAGCRANGTLGVSRHSRRVIAGTLGVLAAAGCRANGNLANARSPSHSLESTFSRFQAPSSTCWRPACCRACCRRPHRRSNSGRQQAHKTQQNVRKHKTRGDKLWMACVCSDESGPQATHATAPLRLHVHLTDTLRTTSVRPAQHLTHAMASAKRRVRP